MNISLEEMKKYLRVDFDEDDELIKNYIGTAKSLCEDITRNILSETDAMRTAIIYATGYLYEHRESANFRVLALTLRALLFGERKECF